MTSPAEILIGKPAAEWRRRDRWTLAVVGGLLAVGFWLVLIVALAVLQPGFRLPAAFVTLVALLDGSVVTFLALRRLPGPRGPSLLSTLSQWKNILPRFRKKKTPPPDSPFDGRV